MQSRCIPGPSRLPEYARPAICPCLRKSHVSRRPLATSASAHAKEASKADDSKLYSKTILLPRTDFQLRPASIAKHERSLQARTTTSLYDWQWQQKERPLFILHDGPPYANGNLHIGHALNKILKDAINRYKVLRGYRVHYQPGWDCHGLPIEHKALQALEKDHRVLQPLEIRKEAKRTAEHAISVQKEELLQFGLLANWDNVYKTFDRTYEVEQLRVFGEMVKKGVIFRASKPVLWSPSSRTALAEAEISYKEDHVSESAFVKFPLKTMRDGLRQVVEQVVGRSAEQASVHVLAWTTTPWTLPANMFIAYSKDINYCLARIPGSSEYYILAQDRVEYLSKIIVQQLEVLQIFQGHLLEGAAYQPPFRQTILPLKAAGYVTSDSGTGLVHSAPAHGQEDYQCWRDEFAKDGLEQEKLISPVDADGLFCQDGSGLIEDTLMQRLEGKAVLADGGRTVLSILRERNLLVAVSKIRHKYPYDWKSKKPVIYRTTPQWFANLDKIKETAITALQKVNFVPAQGRNRLESFVQGRSEWCISRQRAWGVPIPALYDTQSGEAILTDTSISHIIDVLSREGFDYWWTGDVNDFLTQELQNSGRSFVKGTDTMDVWFDSGSSWSSLKASLAQDDRRTTLTDVYLEGSDQHRGWFQSSLLTSIAVTGSAPYANVITHGFVLDDKGTKMSKSVGNVISPLTIINGGKDKAKEPAFGADALRFWAASAGYTREVNISQNIVAKANEDLRKIRNTIRFMLANLKGGAPQGDIQPDLNIIDRYVLHELHQLSEVSKQAFEAFTFNRAMAHLSSFCTEILSQVYFSATKDSLYNDSTSSERRQAVIWTLTQSLPILISILAPVVPHLAEDTWAHWPLRLINKPQSVFQVGWKSADSAWLDPEVAKEMDVLMTARKDVLRLLEEARSEKHIGTSAEVDVSIALTGSYSDMHAIIRKHASVLPALFQVSDVTLHSDEYNDEVAAWQKHATVREGTRSVLSVCVTPSKQQKCPRCWLFTRQSEEKVCKRCDAVLQSL